MDQASLFVDLIAQLEKLRPYAQKLAKGEKVIGDDIARAQLVKKEIDKILAGLTRFFEDHAPLSGLSKEVNRIIFGNSRQAATILEDLELKVTVLRDLREKENKKKEGSRPRPSA